MPFAEGHIATAPLYTKPPFAYISADAGNYEDLRKRKPLIAPRLYFTRKLGIMQAGRRFAPN